jgi:BMFP domain-containing protein YqiC
MLKALARYILRQEPEKTQPQRTASVVDSVSREEFDAAIQKLEQRIEWDLSEWYDKFSTLHARTAKRSQRAQQAQPELPMEPTPRPSVLNYRKPWSV